MKHGNIGEELEKALSGAESPPEAEISRKIAILSFLSMHPCSTSTRVAKFMDTSERGVMWHIDGLVKQGILGRYERNRKARFFVKEQVLEGDCPVFAVLSDERAVRVLTLLEERNAATQTEIMEETGIARNALRRLLESLEDVELIVVVREGRSRRYFLTRKLSRIKETYEERRESAAERIEEALSGLTGGFDMERGVGGFLYVSIGGEELTFSTDPFASIFTG